MAFFFRIFFASGSESSTLPANPRGIERFLVFSRASQELFDKGAVLDEGST